MVKPHNGDGVGGHEEVSGNAEVCGREGNEDIDVMPLLSGQFMLLCGDGLGCGSSPGPTPRPQLVLSFVHDMPLKLRTNPRLLTHDAAAGVKTVRDGCRW